MTAIKKTKTPKYFDFSTRLRKSATRSQNSQLAIALALKVKPKTVKDWFNGIRLPTEKQMQALSVITNTDYDLLVHGPVVEAPPIEAKGVDAAIIDEPTNEPTATEESVEEEIETDTDTDVADQAVSDTDTDADTDNQVISDTDASESSTPVVAKAVQADTATSKQATPKRPKRKVAPKPKQSTAEKISILEQELRELRKIRKKETDAELAKLGHAAQNFAAKNKDFALTMLDVFRQSKPKKADVEIVNSIIQDLEKMTEA